MSFRRNRIVLVVFFISAGLTFGQEKNAELITLKKAIAAQGKTIALLEGDSVVTQIRKIHQTETDADSTAPVKTFLDRDRLLQEARIGEQRLRGLERAQGKGASPKKTLDGWLEQANRPTPKLPYPNPPGLIQDFTRIDKHALAAPVEATKSIPKLAQYLTKEARTDKEKARAIYTWITENIAYDFDNYYKPTTWPDGVLQSKRTVCGGYANLFEGLAKQSGLPASTVPGVARKLDNPLRDPRTLRFNNGIFGGPHSWNLVKLDGKLYLVDPTWGNRHEFIKGKIETRPGKLDYFLTPAEALIYSHMPNDPRLQQLKNPLTQTELAALPLCRPAFFQYGLKIGSAPQPTLSVGDTALVTLQAPTDTAILADVYTLDDTGGNRTPEHAFVQTRDGTTEIRADMPAAGAYKLVIFALKKDALSASGGPDGPNPEEVLAYRVDAQGAKEARPLPHYYSEWLRRGGYLHHPQTAFLEAQKPQSFAVSLPGATEVYVKAGDQRTPLAKRGELFVGEVTPEAGDVVVTAKYPDQASMQFLLKFVAK